MSPGKEPDHDADDGVGAFGVEDADPARVLDLDPEHVAGGGTVADLDVGRLPDVDPGVRMARRRAALDHAVRRKDREEAVLTVADRRDSGEQEFVDAVEQDAVVDEVPDGHVLERETGRVVGDGNAVVHAPRILDHHIVVAVASQTNDPKPWLVDDEGLTVDPRFDPDNPSGRRGIDGGLDRLAGVHDGGPARNMGRGFGIGRCGGAFTGGGQQKDAKGPKPFHRGLPLMVNGDYRPIESSSRQVPGAPCQV